MRLSYFHMNREQCRQIISHFLFRMEAFLIRDELLTTLAGSFTFSGILLHRNRRRSHPSIPSPTQHLQSYYYNFSLYLNTSIILQSYKVLKICDIIFISTALKCTTNFRIRKERYFVFDIVKSFRELSTESSI